MRPQVKILASLAFSLVLCGQGRAADWSGPTVGLQIGSVDHKASWKDLDNDWSNQATFSREGQGVTYGLTAGYNLQFSRLVLGVEGDYSFASAKQVTGRNSETSNRVVRTDDLENMVTLRGKVGFTLDTALFYVTAGAARTSVSHKWIEDNDAPDSWNFKSNKITAVYGAGLAFKLSKNLSANVEYLTVRATKETSTNTSPWFEEPEGSVPASASAPAPASAPGYGFRMEVKDRISLLKFGVTYHF